MPEVRATDRSGREVLPELRSVARTGSSPQVPEVLGGRSGGEQVLPELRHRYGAVTPTERTGGPTTLPHQGRD